MTTGKTDWERLRRMSDEEIARNALHDPDVQPTTEAFWENARVVMPTGKAKDAVSIRFSERVLDFFKKDGRGYQSRINAVLEAHIDSQTNRNI